MYIHVTRSQLELKRARCKISNKGYLSLNIFVILCHKTAALDGDEGLTGTTGGVTVWALNRLPGSTLGE